MQEYEANLEKRRILMNSGQVRVVGDDQAYQHWDEVDVEDGVRRKAVNEAMEPHSSKASASQSSSPIQLNAVAQVRNIPHDETSDSSFQQYLQEQSLIHHVASSGTYD